MQILSYHGRPPVAPTISASNFDLWGQAKSKNKRVILSLSKFCEVQRSKRAKPRCASRLGEMGRRRDLVWNYNSPLARCYIQDKLKSNSVLRKLLDILRRSRFVQGTRAFARSGKALNPQKFDFAYASLRMTHRGVRELTPPLNPNLSRMTAGRPYGW